MALEIQASYAQKTDTSALQLFNKEGDRIAKESIPAALAVISQPPSIQDDKQRPFSAVSITESDPVSKSEFVTDFPRFMELVDAVDTALQNRDKKPSGDYMQSALPPIVSTEEITSNSARFSNLTEGRKTKSPKFQPYVKPIQQGMKRKTPTPPGQPALSVQQNPTLSVSSSVPVPVNIVGSDYTFPCKRPGKRSVFGSDNISNKQAVKRDASERLINAALAAARDETPEKIASLNQLIRKEHPAHFPLKPLQRLLAHIDIIKSPSVSNIIKQLIGQLKEWRKDHCAW